VELNESCLGESLEDHPGANYVASGYAIDPLGLELLEKLFHTPGLLRKNNPTAIFFTVFSGGSQNRRVGELLFAKYFGVRGQQKK
jgi:hypothetical protein